MNVVTIMYICIWTTPLQYCLLGIWHILYVISLTHWFISTTCDDNDDDDDVDGDDDDDDDNDDDDDDDDVTMMILIICVNIIY